MARIDVLHQPLVSEDYEPVGSSKKMNLLLQRSIRYSYRQRCCNCCPTILCELLFPLLMIILLALSRYGINRLAQELNNNDGKLIGNFDQRPCSQNLSLPATSSNTILAKCFKFPPSFSNNRWSSSTNNGVSNETNIIFQPNRTDIQELVIAARNRLNNMNCNTTNVWSKNSDDEIDTRLLQNTTVNTVIIDFSGVSDLKQERKLAYNILVRTPNIILKNDPIDMSFINYKNPGYISDRSNSTDKNGDSGSELPEFSDVKIFVDLLLIEYKTNRQFQYELERNLMSCTPFRDDYLFASPSNFITTIMLMIDAIFFVPYLILLTTLIREKNEKVKEILKVLSIEPILNNLAQAIRTIVLLLILILLLCIVYKLKLKPDAYFNTVNFGTLFLSYFVYSLQLIAFCIMNAQIFNANVRGIVFTFIIYFVSTNLHTLAMSWPIGIQYILIFLSPFIAGHSIFQQAVLYDLANKDVAYFQTIYRNVPMYFITLIVILASCVFYWALSWYLEKVFPGEYGVPLDWNFIFKREYWHRSSTKIQTFQFDNNAASSTRPGTPLVRTNTNGIPVVRVERLVKAFGPDKIAVNDVSFDLYENQITSLLGPNGSGKTTIFNCLIGIYKQTSGTITIENESGIDYDTRTNMEMLRKSIGYCPQHDILFDLLTIKEQIEFYASARGYARSKQQISNEMLRLVNLEQSKHVFCKSLSGGMKRRLSLACAFVGDTKIVLLDEPSSGLDPSNRRLLWDWLRTMKEGKTLLLTTHFMEESDALSDRIMIISNGVIKADGTSARLKELYGSGYKLIINKQQHYSTKQIENELRTYLPQLTVESDIFDGDIVLRTNQQPDSKFVQCLRELEKMKIENRIKNYGVQNSTMDDVFLKITKDQQDHHIQDLTSVNMEHIDEQCRYIFNEKYFSHGFYYYLSQLHGLLIKTLLVRYRRWGITLIILLLPIAYNLLSNIISRSQNTGDTYKMQPNLLNPQTIYYTADSSMENYFQSAFQSKSKHFVLEKRSENITGLNQYIWERRKKRPYTYTDTYLAFQVDQPEKNIYKIQALSSNLISGHEILSVASNTFLKYALNDTDVSIETTLVYKKTGNLTLEPTLGSLLNVLSIASCFLKILPTSLILDVIVFYLIFLYTVIFLVSERKDSFLSLLNISGLHPTFYWIFNYLFDVIISIIWFCYILAIYCLIDVAFNGLPSHRSSSSSIIPIEFANPWDLRVQFYPLTIIIALPTFPFAYLLTKIFKSDILCGLSVLLLLVILHLISIIVPIIMAIINNVFVQKLVYWILNAISPSINAQVIVTYILARQSQFCKIFTFGDISLFKPIGDDTIAWNWVILILHIIILLLLLIAIDSGLFKFLFSFSFLTHRIEFDENMLDNDVLAERQRILRLNDTTTEMSHATSTEDSLEEMKNIDHLAVHDLVKCFPGRNVNAVNHLTFGAKYGEAFGLLGYNGAGKTTTFRILVGDEVPTKGVAYIDGQNVRRRFRSLRRLGYCPQENCSMDYLTVRDALYLIARIRGVHSSRIFSIVQTISLLFLLEPFLHNYIHQLSGGTKRRLHAALALIGPPAVAILDEPTTGVDPNARQQMQEIFLNAIKSKLTIILTSHSMDECERVCNRLGIMVNGQLACLGTIQHLKSKFSEGYTIEIKVRLTSNDMQFVTIQNVQNFLLSQTNFDVQIREITYSTGSFQIKRVTPADIFQLLEQNKQQLNIETYTISQTTLEQIFLSFGKNIDENGLNKKNN